MLGALTISLFRVQRKLSRRICILVELFLVAASLLPFFACGGGVAPAAGSLSTYATPTAAAAAVAVSIAPHPASPSAVAGTDPEVSVTVNQSLEITASVTGTSNTAVSWTAG